MQTKEVNECFIIITGRFSLEVPHHNVIENEGEFKFKVVRIGFTHNSQDSEWQPWQRPAIVGKYFNDLKTPYLVACNAGVMQA